MTSDVFIGATSVLFYLNLTHPIGWALLILGISLSLALNQIKIDPIKEWLYKNFLGERHVKWFYSPYKSYYQQQNELQKILKE